MRIVRSNRELREEYHRLGPGDVVATVLRLSPGEEGLLLDLVDRGIELFPPALAQWLSRSKVLQARLLGQWMVPGTAVVGDRRDLIEAMARYGEMGVGPVVTKRDRGDCGLGVNRWGSVEDVFNWAGQPPLEYPFVLQPLVEGATDVRVVMVGEYLEAYWRRNPHSFRNNISWGGDSGPYRLNEEELELCRQVMERGRFPYAFLDLMVTGNGAVYLSEISLRGGLHGARLTQPSYLELVASLEEEFIEGLRGGGAPQERRVR